MPSNLSLIDHKFDQRLLLKMEPNTFALLQCKQEVDTYVVDYNPSTSLDPLQLTAHYFNIYK